MGFLLNYAGCLAVMNIKFQGFLGVYQWYFKGCILVSRVFQGLLREFQGWFRDVSGVYQGCFKGTSKVLQW